VRAPTTLGTFLRAFAFGHVRQLDAVASRFLADLATRAPALAGAGQVCFVDVDDTIRETHGHKKQGDNPAVTGAPAYSGRSRPRVWG